MLLIKVILVYLLLSFWEWFIHCLIMHGDKHKLKKIPVMGPYLADVASSHLTHHKEVNMDMKLNNITDIHSLFFGWNVCFILTILMFGSLVTIGFSLKHASILSVLLGMLVCFLWNNWHTDMHDSNVTIAITEGIPNQLGLISRGPVYNWLKRYHTTHHLQKGNKYNYNIIFPGFDHLMGTYQECCVDNTNYCKNTADQRCLSKQTFCF